MQIWKDGAAEGFTPPNHFGNLKTLDVVPFKGNNFAVQVSRAPKGGGGELHSHDDWSQVFFVMQGELTFDTGSERFTLKAGEAVLFEPTDPHYTINEADQDSVSLVITVQQ
ncbi:cupin domain-containing protein [Paracoccus sulfuroxidans]|uniref:Cupin domain-containing protein n=1 Tax=Paracoccus sulfuroxidans TaxID=384678 RepID=A0A562NGB6_9RHOB|nr:cupin domain-containing protein [Paracoccus sulfuroxidans]TWI31249.1 Cupin domain-containing protein [Paracoccus sulfuroxidans]